VVDEDNIDTDSAARSSNVVVKLSGRSSAIAIQSVSSNTGLQRYNGTSAAQRDICLDTPALQQPTSVHVECLKWFHSTDL